MVPKSVQLLKLLFPQKQNIEGQSEEGHIKRRKNPLYADHK